MLLSSAASPRPNPRGHHSYPIERPDYLFSLRITTCRHRTMLGSWISNIIAARLRRSLSLCAHGMTVRESQGGSDNSPDLISRVTDAPLMRFGNGRTAPRNFFNALRVKIRDVGLVNNKAAYVG
jgi:hypothetical protein